MAVILLFVMAFFWFQRYIVYTPDGIRLDIPFWRDILDEILVAANAATPARDLAERTAKLEAELAKLRIEVRRHDEEKRLLASENLALLYRARIAEAKLASLQRQATLTPAA